MKYSALRRLVELQTGGKMKREVDFIAEFEKENAELKQEKTNPSPPTEEEYRKKTEEYKQKKTLGENMDESK